jgi:hypothetical protein
LHENYPRSQKKAPHDPSPPFKEKEKGGEGGSKAWWLMEGSKAWWPMEGSKAWWPMEGSKAWWPMEGSKAWWPMEGSKLGGHWNVPSLVAIGMFQAWWPLECEG